MKTPGDVDVLVADALGGQEDDDEPEIQSAGPSALEVCNVVVDGKVCGASFATKRQLSTHTMAKHKVTLDGTPVSPRGTGTKARSQATDQPPARQPRKTKTQTVRNAMPEASDRGKLYGATITSAAVMAHFGSMLLSGDRWFPDSYDLDIITRSSPLVGNALAEVGDKNDAVRRACDAILLAGGGGAYVQLTLALLVMAIPIAAHHGAFKLSPEIGSQFANMIGAMAPTAPSPETPPAPEQTSHPAVDDTGPVGPATNETGLPRDTSSWTLDEWKQVMFSMPPNVMMDLAKSQGVDMSNVTAIPDMPGTEPFVIPDEEHRGSTGTNGPTTSTDDTVQSA